MAPCNGYWLYFITQWRNLTLRNTAYIQDPIYQVAYVSKKKLSCQHSGIKTALRNHSQTYTIPWMCGTVRQLPQELRFRPISPEMLPEQKDLFSSPPQNHSELTQKTSSVDRNFQTKINPRCLSNLQTTMS